MDGILNIFQSITQADTKDIIRLSKSIDEHQSFRGKTTGLLDPVILHITTNLQNHGSRYESLLILNEFILQCPLAVLEQKGALWISLCTKICAQKQQIDCIPLAYNVLGKLLEKSTHIPDLGKSIASNLLSKIVESTVNAPPSATLAAMKCLEICMKTYPGPCGVVKGHIAKAHLKVIDTHNEIELEQAAKCLHLLQQVRGGGAQGISHKNSWTEYQLQLIGTLHEHFDLLFANAAETFDGSNVKERLNIPELNLRPEPVVRASQLITRITNLTEFLRVMLVEPYPVSKAIHPMKIIGVISRGLAVNCTTLSKNLISDNIAVGALLPQLHVKLFKLLDSLFVTLRGNMMLYHNQVIHLVTQSLKWTSSGKAFGYKRPYCSIRIAAYNTLALWCKTIGYTNSLEVNAENIIGQILQDVTPFQSEVTLQVLEGGRKNLSKKARKRLHKALNETTNLSQTHSTTFNPQNTKIIHSDNGNEDLCSAALNSLTNLLETAGCFIKPVLHKILQETIVSLAFNEVSSTNCKKNLFTSELCRLNLYKSLNSLVVSPHHLCSPPMQYALTIFSSAQIRDKSLKVRIACSNFIKQYEKILHPLKESLFFPAELTAVKDAMQIESKNIDENELRFSTDDEEDIEVNFQNKTTEKIDAKVQETINNDSDMSVDTVIFDQTTIREKPKEQKKSTNEEEKIDLTGEGSVDFDKYELSDTDNEVMVISEEETNVEKNITKKTEATPTINLDEEPPKKMKKVVAAEVQEVLNLDLNKTSDVQEAIVDLDKTSDDIVAEMALSFVDEPSICEDN